MITLPCLDNGVPFPAACQALKEPDGLLAFGGELSTTRLLQAYRLGIFPWYSAEQPVLWWSPSQRMVLQCNQFKISHNLGKLLKRIARQERQPDAQVVVTTDMAFEQVMRACAAPRGTQTGTWITDEMIAAYVALHHQGYAHSVEVRQNGQLMGGLYGICIGRMFYGESMFSHSSNTSKIALATLVRFLQKHEVPWIDCQQDTPHLARMGAQPMPRSVFLRHVAQAVTQPGFDWPPGQMLADGIIVPPM